MEDTTAVDTADADNAADTADAENTTNTTTTTTNQTSNPNSKDVVIDFLDVLQLGIYIFICVIVFR